MTKEAFVEKKQFIQSELDRLRSELKQAESDYIEANKRFNIGDRIKKVDKEEFGYITGFRVDWSNDVLEYAVKEKKDGTESKHQMFIYKSKDIESAPRQ